MLDKKEMLNSKGGQVVYETILGDILSGKLRPSERIPSRVDLIRRFKTTPVTLQRAFDRLAEAGFIESRGRQGTFVVQHPPHRHRIGLVFRSKPERPEWRRFWTILRSVAGNMAEADDWTFDSFLEIENTGSPGRNQFAYDVENHRLAGVFHVTKATMEETPAANEIPRAVMATSDDARIEETLSILPDMRQFIAEALNRLVSCGCRRVALIATPGFRKTFYPIYTESLEALNLPVERKWIQTGNLNAPSECANLTELLFSQRGSHRPDGLLVMDDNLAPHVCDGLAQAGLMPARDVAIVSHANYPSPSVSAGVVRLGFDNGAILRSAVSYFRKCRDRGRLMTELTVIPPIFEPPTPPSARP